MCEEVKLKVVSAISGSEVASDVPCRLSQTVVELKRALELPTATPAQYQKLLLEGGCELSDEGKTLDEAGVTAQAGNVVLLLHRQPVESGRLLSLCDQKNEELALVRYILEFTDSESINAKGSVGRTALHMAARNGQDRVCHLLLEDSKFLSENDVDKKGWTALHFAARHGHEKVVQVLLDAEKFSEVDAVTENGQTALHIASREGQQQVCECLLESERFAAVHAVDAEGATALHLAAFEGRLEVCQLLLNLSSKFTAVNVKDKHGRTALDFAKKRGTPKHKEICCLLQYSSSSRIYYIIALLVFIFACGLGWAGLGSAKPG